jgi:hypothetical protein
MRTVKLDREVEDASGLFFDLIKAGFEVASVSVERNETSIHLEDEEEKDPAHVAELWAGKAETAPSMSVIQERRRIYEDFLSGKEERRSALRARKESSGAAPSQIGYQDADPEVLTLSPAQKMGWIKKLFKLW